MRKTKLYRVMGRDRIEYHTNRRAATSAAFKLAGIERGYEFTIERMTLAKARPAHLAVLLLRNSGAAFKNVEVIHRVRRSVDLRYAGRARSAGPDQAEAL